MKHLSRESAFTLVELLVVVSIIALLICLLLPAVQAAREAARQTQCATNLKQIALAMHTFHDARGHLPQGLSDCCNGTWLVQILPYLEREALFEQYVNFGGTGSPQYSASSNATVAATRLTVATCPSDKPRSMLRNITTGPTLTKHNYAVNYGNTGLVNVTIGTNYNFQADLNGVVFAGAPFGSRITYSFSDITDGLSNTLLLAEVVQTEGADVRGLLWWGDAAGFSTYCAPNSSQPDVVYSSSVCSSAGSNPPCTSVSNPSFPASLYGARSRHAGGVYATLCDGSIRFINNGIDINTWRALSTIHGNEMLSANY